ncbi:MAG: divalent-cation tolerance protein CutA [Acidobacteria bacterium]|nr:divalent-cation tolerance protein CutA [Acidobacteriota bacterium]
MTVETTSAVVVLVTWPADQDVAPLARALVDERLAACVNVLPAIRSFYHWEGAVHDEPEQQLVIKTLASAVPRLQARVQDLHPYDVPEFLVMPVAAGSAAYLEWLAASVAH